MTKQRNKLYLFLIIACVFGYLWILINTKKVFHSAEFTACLIKKATNFPCPSCGSTRAVLEILNGNILNALQINPLGLIISILMVIIPIWIIFDFLSKSDSFYKTYRKVEFYFKKPIIYIPFMILILINWFWNFSKNL